MRSTDAAARLPRRSSVAWRWGLLAGYMACIFILSSIPGRSLPQVRISDKLLHVGEYGLLSVFMCRALRGQMPAWPRARIALLGALAAVGYGATDEFHQLFVPYRSADLTDLAADSLGAILAAWGWYKASVRWPRVQ